MLYYLVYIFNMAGIVRVPRNVQRQTVLTLTLCRYKTLPLPRRSSNMSSSWLLQGRFFSSSTRSAVDGSSLSAR
jgi:hypothetical protein